MSSVAELLVTAGATLTEAGVSSARLDSEVLLAWVLCHNRAWLIAHSNDKVTINQSKKYQAAIAQRVQRQPVAYIIGRKQFYGLDFIVTPAVLTPRPETELVVEQILAQAPQNARVLDIGTGCGAMAVALAHHRADLNITASDISAEALAVARQNAAELAPKATINFVQSDLFESVTGQFDVIAANLPYVPDEMKPRLMPETNHEPAVALFGGIEGLQIYERFFTTAKRYLDSSGVIYCESDPWQRHQLKNLAQKNGFIAFYEDYLICGFKPKTDSQLKSPK